LQKPKKNTTFKFFNYKWNKVPTWASDTEEIYRQWYLERYGYNTLDNLSQFLQDKKRILEAGCGLARDSKMFAELNNAVEIVAMDQSKQALKIAQNTLGQYNNCHIVQGDITNFKIKGKFDFISCDQVLHHTPDPEKTLRHLYSYLEMDGILIFSVCRKKINTAI
jgi:SAM-dependent methyltransferase